MLSLNGKVGGFCGYHLHGKYNASTSRDNLIWGTVQGYQQSGNGQAFVGSISYCISHELSEALSNPDGQGYINDNGCEIGDICEAGVSGSCCITVPYTVSGRMWNVERYWSNLDARCLIGPAASIFSGRPVGGSYESSDRFQHTMVGTSDGKVHELYWQPAKGVHEDVLYTFLAK